MSLLRGEWREIWEKTNNIGHALNSNYWHVKYADELLMFLKPKSNQTCVDTGCGTCEVLIHLTPHYKKIIGLDFSKAMIDRAQVIIKDSRIDNLTVYYSDIMDIREIVNERVDIIFNNQVVQYLNQDELKHFIIDSLELLNDEGVLFLFNIPNKSKKILFGLGFFKRENPIKLSTLLLKILKFKIDLIKERLKNFKYEFTGDCGNWYTIEQIKELTREMNINIEFFSPIYLHHSYRFHVKISKVKLNNAK